MTGFLPSTYKMGWSCGSLLLSRFFFFQRYNLRLFKTIWVLDTHHVCSFPNTHNNNNNKTNNQQPTTNNNQQQPTTNNNQQQPTTTNNNQQQPTTTNNQQQQQHDDNSIIRFLMVLRRKMQRSLLWFSSLQSGFLGYLGFIGVSYKMGPLKLMS